VVEMQAEFSPKVARLRQPHRYKVLWGGKGGSTRPVLNETPHFRKLRGVGPGERGTCPLTHIVPGSLGSASKKGPL
jgi:hypothetical protein